ncbi:hypothetical protein BSFP_029920 [Burkholderia stabilis]|uniref:Uncharacterized protein n=1 Tax=Burkholderia stabilis TaxID=95485 RepID=A0A1Y1BJD1_9BURK|nr:hypothetical protein BSFP_029920 [Burkholderia stabilis]
MACIEIVDHRAKRVGFGLDESSPFDCHMKTLVRVGKLVRFCFQRRLERPVRFSTNTCMGVAFKVIEQRRRTLGRRNFLSPFFHSGGFF